MSRPPASTEKKGRNVVNKDGQPIINVEVIVPHIVLPTIRERAISVSRSGEKQQNQELREGSSEPGRKEEEHVRLVLYDPSSARKDRQSQDQQGTESTASSYTFHKRPFSLFHIKEVPVQGQKLLLQVLRQWRNKQHAHEDRKSLKVTDELMLALEQRHFNAEASFDVELIPGLNHVTVIFDEEGTLTGYRIDGTES